MAVSGEQIEAALDLLQGVGPVASRKMFGGVGFYADGTIFAVLMSDGTLRLKGAGEMADAFDAAGWERWTYTREGRTGSTAMPYWRVPDALLDDADAVSGWARRALAAL
jgi:DNA transformation protein